MCKICFKLLLGLLVLACSASVSGQSHSSVDIVRINAKYEREAMYFYQENWQAFRKAALDKGFISGFEMLRGESDSTNHFQLILITEYPDKSSYEKREENFGPIMKSISPNGPKMLNNIERKVFLEYIAGYDTYTIMSSARK